MTDEPVVTAIHIAPATRLPMKALDSVEAETQKGLVGDRYHGTRHRHVSVQSQTQLDDASADFGADISTALTRRNITISHGNVPSNPGDRIRIGDVDLEVVRIAAPCKMLDMEIGEGARKVLSRRAGSICRVLAGGTIAIGDDVSFDVGAVT